MAQAYDDAMDLAIDFVRDRIRTQTQRMGLSDTLPGLRADFGTNGGIILQRDRRCFDEDSVVETHLSATGNASRPIDNRSMEALDRAIARHVRRNLRLQAISAGEDSPPVWSYTVHRLAKAWMLAKGMDPTMATGGPKGIGTTALKMLADQADVGLGAISCEDGRLDVVEMVQDGMVLLGKGRPTLLIEREVPETMAKAMVGRRLCQVLDHEVLRKAGPARIMEANVTEGVLQLILEDRQDHLRRPPIGADRRWNRIPFDPQPGDN